MRAILLLFLAFSSTAFAEFRATLLSWEQLKALTPQARAEYLADYRKLLIMMDQQQTDHDLVAVNYKMDFDEKVAFVMRLFSIVPQAEAIDHPNGILLAQVGSEPAAPDPVTVEAEKKAKEADQRSRAMWDFNDRLKAREAQDKATREANAAAARAKQAEAARKSAEVERKSAESSKADFLNTLKKKEMADKAARDPNKPVETGKPGSPEAVPGIGEDSCPEPAKRNCSGKPDPGLVKTWRESQNPDDNTCIMGGFFSSYENPNPRKQPGKCKRISQFPQNSDKPVMKCTKPNETLCNPFVFCAVGKDKTGEHPLLNCVPKSVNGKSDVTKRCEDWQNIEIKKCEERMRREGHNPQPGECSDPTQFQMDGAQPFAKEWYAQKKDFEDNFNKRCFKTADGKTGYEELFCNECEIMKRILYKMNKKAIKFGCASIPASKPAAAPASVAPAAPAGGAGGVEQVIPPAPGKASR